MRAATYTSSHLRRLCDLLPGSRRSSGASRRRAPAATVEWGHRQPVNVEGRKSASVWVRRRRQSIKSWSRRITVSVSLRCFPTFSTLLPISKPTLWRVVVDACPPSSNVGGAPLDHVLAGRSTVSYHPLARVLLCTGSGLNHRVLGIGTSKPGDCHHRARTASLSSAPFDGENPKLVAACSSSSPRSTPTQPDLATIPDSNSDSKAYPAAANRCTLIVNRRRSAAQ